MPLVVPLTTAQTDYVRFGGAGVYAGGWIFNANGLLEVILLHGASAGQSTESGPFVVPPGYSPLAAGARPDFVTGLKVRAYNRTLSSPAQEFTAALFEPGVASVVPTASFPAQIGPGGAVIVPGLDTTDGVTSVNPTSELLIGANLVLTNPSAGVAQIDAAVPPAEPVRLLASWAGTLPSSTGNGLVWEVPYDSDGSSFAFTLARATARIEDTFTAATQIRIEKSPGGGAFTPTTVTTLGINAGSYEATNTGIASTVTSGDLLRIVFTAVGAQTKFMVELIGSE